MLFNSIQYGCFLVAVVAVYYTAPRAARLWVLLAGSYLFYASYNLPFLLLIMGLTAVNYLFGLALGGPGAATGSRRVTLTLAIVIDLGVLGFFKYLLFLIHSLGSVLGWAGIATALPQPSIFLPLGISFFTFEFIHYLVDVYRGGEPVGSLLRFAVFAAFFPTQIAGPIKRYQAFVPQLEERAPLDPARIADGVRLIALGFFKKVALADNLAPLVAAGFAPSVSGLTFVDAWLVTLAFAMQIYFDFSGFTDFARGSARLLGYEVPQNFQRPYMAVNPSDFWRRWHMSLSTWFRDYLYIPLGGRRVWRYRNLFLTMLVAGLWHGASWTFVVWGAFHGVLLVGYWLGRSGGHDSRAPAPGVGVLGWLVTFPLVCAGWVFFRAGTLGKALSLLGSMLGVASGGHEVLSGIGRLFIVGVVIGTLVSEAVLEWQAGVAGDAERGGLARAPAAWRAYALPAGYAVLVAVALVFQQPSGPPFIYFHF